MPKGKNRHLTLEDRIRIERGIDGKESFASIARDIGVATSTVSREVGANREVYVPKGRSFNVCEHKRDCSVTNACGPTCELGRCRSCARVRCNDVCPGFEERTCLSLERAPFVCSDCYRRGNCGFQHARYRAVRAQMSYEARDAGQGAELRGDMLVGQPAGQGEREDPLPLRGVGILGMANIELPRT